MFCDEMGFIGTKEGCLIGDCGVCSVLINGCFFCLCLVFGVEVEGQELMMVEGLVDGDKLYLL